MNPILALLALGGTTVAAVAVVASRKAAAAKPAAKPAKLPEPLELNQSKAVLATVDQGTTSRSSTINSYGRRGGQAGRGVPPAAKKTLGSVISTMMKNEGPEAFDRKRKAMGPSGSIVTEKRAVPRGIPLSTVAAAYMNARSQQTRVVGVTQLVDKSDARQIVSPSSAPALARGTGFTFNGPGTEDKKFSFNGPGTEDKKFSFNGPGASAGAFGGPTRGK